MPRQKGNEEPQKHNHEEPQAGHSRRMSRVRDQDVQDREGLKLISQVAEPLKGWVSVQKDTQPFSTDYIHGCGYARPQQKSFLNCLSEFNLVTPEKLRFYEMLIIPKVIKSITTPATITPSPTAGKALLQSMPKSQAKIVPV